MYRVFKNLNLKEINQQNIEKNKYNNLVFDKNKSIVTCYDGVCLGFIMFYQEL